LLNQPIVSGRPTNEFFKAGNVTLYFKTRSDALQGTGEKHSREVASTSKNQDSVPKKLVTDKESEGRKSGKSSASKENREEVEAKRPKKDDSSVGKKSAENTEEYKTNNRDERANEREAGVPKPNRIVVFDKQAENSTVDTICVQVTNTNVDVTSAMSELSNSNGKKEGNNV